MKRSGESQEIFLVSFEPVRGQLKFCLILFFVYQMYKRITKKQYAWNVTTAFKGFLKGRCAIRNVFDNYRLIQNGIRGCMQNVCKGKRLCCIKCSWNEETHFVDVQK